MSHVKKLPSIHSISFYHAEKLIWARPKWSHYRNIIIQRCTICSHCIRSFFLLNTMLSIRNQIRRSRQQLQTGSNCYPHKFRSPVMWSARQIVHTDWASEPPSLASQWGCIKMYQTKRNWHVSGVKCFREHTAFGLDHAALNAGLLPALSGLMVATTDTSPRLMTKSFASHDATTNGGASTAGRGSPLASSHLSWSPQ